MGGKSRSKLRQFYPKVASLARVELPAKFKLGLTATAASLTAAPNWRSKRARTVSDIAWLTKCLH